MSDEKSLDLIGIECGTDKSSMHHDYLSFYELFLGSLRDREMKILEIGIFDGASLATWKAFFPRATIVGVDIVPSAKRFESDRILVETADQSNIEDMTAIALRHGPFDLVIDDGSHFWEHQITSMKILFPFLKNAGYYIIEDLQTNYGSLGNDHRRNATISCVDYLKKMVDLRVGDNQIDIEAIEDPFLRTYGRAFKLITFYRGACLIEKDVIQLHRGSRIGSPIRAPKGAKSAIKVLLTAHVAFAGDVIGQEGYVNSARDYYVFQGLSISLPDDGDDLVEYRVQFADGLWTDWVGGGHFAGTRGENKDITGVTVRLTNGPSGINLEYSGRFAGHSEIVTVESGQDLVSTAAGRKLTGLQLDLWRS